MRFTYVCHPLHRKQMEDDPQRLKDVGIKVKFDRTMPVDKGLLIDTKTGKVTECGRIPIRPASAVPSEN